MGFLKIIQNIAVESVLHHLAHALSAFLVGDIDKVNRRRKYKKKRIIFG